MRSSFLAKRFALILDGLCLHVLSSFQRTGLAYLRHLREFLAPANLTNLQQPISTVNYFLEPLDFSYLSARFDEQTDRRRRSRPENFPTDVALVKRAELEDPATSLGATH